MTATPLSPKPTFVVTPLRVGLALALVLAGAGAAVMSLAAIAAERSPALGAKLDRDSASAQNLIAMNLLGRPSDTKLAASAFKASQESLAKALVNPEALRNLALAYAATGKTKLATETMRLAESQSRRDMSVQFWMIEDSVQRGDVAGTLVHYDRALRSNPAAQITLFPILAEALTDPSLSSELARVFKQGAPWASRFVDYVIGNSPHIVDLSRALRAAGGVPSGPMKRNEERTILDRLAAEGHLPEAMRFGRTLAGANATALSEPSLTVASVDPRFAPLTWRINDTVAGAVPLQAGNASKNDVALDINIYPDTSQIVAQKVQFLASKQFLLTSQMTFRSMSQKDFAIWEMACPTKDGNPVFARSEPIRAAGTRTIETESRFTAPCSPVMIQLRVFGGNGLDPNVLNVRAVRIAYAQ